MITEIETKVMTIKEIVNLINFYYEKGEYEAALSVIDVGIAKYSSNSRLWTERGKMTRLILESNSNNKNLGITLSNARECFENALEHDPDYVPALVELAKWNVEFEHNNKASSLFMKAMDLVVDELDEVRSGLDDLMIELSKDRDG